MAFVLSFFFLTYIVDFLVRAFARGKGHPATGATDASELFFCPSCYHPQPARSRAKKGLTEKGDMVHDPARADAAGEGQRPMAPYAVARDMGPNQDPAAYQQNIGQQA